MDISPFTFRQPKPGFTIEDQKKKERGDSFMMLY